MFKNNFISVIRNLWKSKTITTVNLIGLTLGLTVSIMLIILIKHENGFDAFHKNKNSLCRVLTVSKEQNSNQKTYHTFTPSALGENLKANFPELKNMISVTIKGSKMRIGEVLHEEKAFYVDNNFLRIFSFNMISGNAQTALSDPNSVILSKSFAKKIFGDKDSFNQMVTINKKAFKITGILEDTPANSTFQFSALFSINSLQFYNELLSSWSNNLTDVYINLPANMERTSTEKMINEYTKRYKNETPFSEFALQPLLRMHLYSANDYGIVSRDPSEGSITNLIIYTFFVFFILLTAIINFTNISFNQIFKKINEIGMRRILGASKMQIFLRSWLESLIVCAISFTICLLIIQAVMPEFNSLIKRKIEFSSILENSLEIGIVILSVTVLLGLLPALKLMNLSNPRLLRRGVNFSNSNKSVKGMLVVQFAIALFFLITTLLVTRQMQFVNSKHNINDDEDIIQVSNLRNEKATAVQSKLLFEAIAQNNLIKMATYEQGTGVRSASKMENFEVNGIKKLISFDKVEKGFFSMFNYKMKMGRAFDAKKFPSDTADAIILNEAMVKKFAIKNPLNSTISCAGKNYRIIGVVEDYTLSSLKEEATPLALLHASNIMDFYFRVTKQNEKAALDMIKAEWKRYYPDQVFAYSFYNEIVMKDYNSEIIAHKLFKLLSILSISLSLLGVVGLSSLMLIKRKKEIAIRKILGASIHNLILHFSKEFGVVIAIGFIIACAASYNYIDKFLADFKYKTDIDSIPFLISLGIILITVFAAITIQSLKSLYANPIESIKSE